MYHQTDHSPIMEETLFSSHTCITTNIMISPFNTPKFNSSLYSNQLPPFPQSPSKSNSPSENDDSSASLPRKKVKLKNPQPHHDKKRKVKDYYQLNILKKYYFGDQSPNQSKIREISMKTGLTYYQVYKWFWEQKRKTVTSKTGDSHSNDPTKKTTNKIRSVRQGEGATLMFACVEVRLPKEDPISEEAVDPIRNLMVSKLILLK